MPKPCSSWPSELLARTITRWPSATKSSGQLLDQSGDRTKAKPYLLKAHAVLEKAKPPDQRTLYRSARRLAFLCDNLGQQDEAIRYYEKAIAAGTQLDDLPYADLGTMLNNVALIFRQLGRQKAAEPYYLHALEIYEKQLGPEHADVASVLNNLARLLHQRKALCRSGEDASPRAGHSAKRRIRRRIPTSRNRNAIWRWFIIRAAITRKRPSFIAHRSQTWEEATEQPPEDYEIVASNYADLLRSLGKARKAQQLEARARKRRRG